MVGGQGVQRGLAWVRRIPPLRLAVAAGVAAVLAVALFAGSSALRGHGPASGLRAIDPSDAGLASLGLDAQGIQDRDHDGLADVLENAVYGSDPNQWNSSGTPLPDGWLAVHHVSPLDVGAAQRPAAVPPAADLPAAYHNRWPARFTPTLLDVYRHGRPADWDEARQGPFQSGLDPRAWDSNHDGIPDGWLLHYGLDPLNASVGALRLSTPPGLTVREAFEHDTDPTATDSDGDGLSDATEIAGARNPRAPDGPPTFPPSDPSRFDTGGSGACDGFLVAHGLDPGSPSAPYEDPDHDGATTREEYRWSAAHLGAAAACSGKGLDPRSASSGGAPIPDGWLIRYGLDPFQAGVAKTVTQSSDRDPGPPSGVPKLELTVQDEYLFGRPPGWNEAQQGPWFGGTDPTNNDTDGDGLGDAWEMAGYALNVSTEANHPQTYAATLDPTKADSDGDGLTDPLEVAHGTDGRRQDTDFDGLPDGMELGLDLGLNPRLADSTADAVRFPDHHQGDGLRDGERYRMLANRSAAYNADPTYEHPGPPGQSVRSITDLPWVAARLGPSPSLAQAAALFGPGGDADGDGIPNVVDADMDNDTLPNGRELHPTFSGPGFLKVIPSASDPLNPDTDGDGLRDAWEVAYGVPGAQGSSLDPAKWDSNGNNVPDGLEDPDADSIVWHDLRGSPPAASTGTYAHDNLREQQFGTDPNDPDTDRDGLRDGWEVYWGAIQVQPGATHLPNVKVPQLASDPSSLLFTATYRRFVTDPSPTHLVHDANDPTRVVEADAGHNEAAKDGTTLHNMTGTLQFRFHDAQRLGTGPYRLDSDGDGAPDWWEDLHGRALPKLRDSLGAGDRTSDLAGCVSAAGLSPVLADGGADPDQDRLSNADEFADGGDPLCADTDLGGVVDGEEASLGLQPNRPNDDISQTDPNLDTDHDGVPDRAELAGKLYSDLGSRPVKTNRTDPDTDGDGLLDGPDLPASGCWTLDDTVARAFLDLGIAYRKSGSCYTFLGERPTDHSRTTDPRDGDDCRCGVPAGWLAAYDRPIAPSSSQYLAHYTLGMPAWWTPGLHGPWWGGANPLDASQDIGALKGLDDLDADGLQDRDPAGGPAEDAFPAANSLNVLRPPSTLAGVKLPERMAAQAVVNPAQYLGTRPAVSHPANPPPDHRATACLGSLALGDPSGPAVLAKGTPATLTGRLTRCDSTPAAGVAVQALFSNVQGQPRNLFGAGFTDADGRFSFPVTLSAETHSLTIPPDAASAFRGNVSGLVEWRPAAGAAKAGSGDLLVRSYAVGRLDSTAGLMRAEQSLPVQVTATAQLLLDAPTQVLTGEPVPIRLRLVDSGGAPYDGVPVDLLWNGEHRSVLPIRGVYESDLPPVDPADAGQVVLSARAEPSGSPPVTAQATLTALAPGLVELQHLDRTDAGQALLVAGQVRRVAGVGAQASVPGATVLVNLTRSGATVATAQLSSDGNGQFKASLDLPRELSAGLYNVSAAALPTAKSAAAQTEAPVQVRSLPQFRSVTRGNLTVGTPHAVTARLLDAQGEAVAGAPVDVTFGSTTVQARTDADGTLSARLDAPERTGVVLQSLSFAGDERHAGASDRAERTVLSGTRLHLQGGEAARGADAEVAAHLADGAGGAVPGATIGFQWGGESPRFLTTDSEGDALFRRAGHADDALGPVLLRAWFAGSPGAGLGNSSATAVWTLRSLSAIDLPAGPVAAGGSAPMATLIDAGTRAPLAGRAVTVRLAERSAASVVTDADGRFPVMEPVPALANPSVVRVVARFDGDDAYPPAHAAGNLSIRSPTSVVPHLPAVVVAGQPTLVAVDVVDARGLPAQGGTLRALGHGEVGSAAVDGDTVHLTIELPANSSAGATQLEFVYGGSDSHGPATAHAQVEVVSRAILTAAAEPARVGHQARLVVRLQIAGQPAAGQPVTVQFEGVPAGIVATTDGNGTASFSVQQSTSALDFLARYGGNPQASPALAAGQLIAVTPAGVLKHGAAVAPWVLAALALALGAGAVVALRVPKHPLAAAFTRARRLVAARGEPERQILLAYAALEDSAIAAEVLGAPAHTPRLLEEALRPALPPALHGNLAHLIALFEDARYGRAAMGDPHRRAALHELRTIDAALARTARTPFAPAGVPG